MSQTADTFRPGMYVQITHQIPNRNRVWTTVTRGKVLKYEQKKTGSWYAHAKDEKLWLDRLTIEKDDGEIAIVHLDPFVHVEQVDDPSQK